MKYQLIRAVTLSAGLALVVGCTGFKEENEDQGSLSSTNTGGTLLSQVHLSVKNSLGSTIYSDQIVGSSLTLKEGESYTITLDTGTAPAGSVYVLTVTRTDVVGGGSTTLNLVPGDNTFSISSFGDYTWQLSVTAPGRPTTSKIYQAEVECANPTFSSADAGISAALIGSNNLFTYSVSGLTGNGMAPYTCALDPSGVGIQDTTFKACSSFTPIYNNYVDTRQVGLLVKDACNKTVAVTKSVVIPKNYPIAMGVGNVFVYGQTSNAQGTAQGDRRDDGVTYLATNVGGNNIVQPMGAIDGNGSGDGSFTIDASYNYDMPSGTNFGMQIQLQGVTDTIDRNAGTGTISVANASIKKVIYSTDRAGDNLPAQSFSGSSCTLSNQNAKVLFVMGQPCSAGSTSNTNRATIEIWGHYKCTALNAGGGALIDIEGDFDGLYDIADSCVGGGGQGGGGIVPINL
jgi:hypothetical protein